MKSARDRSLGGDFICMSDDLCHLSPQFTYITSIYFSQIFCLKLQTELEYYYVRMECVSGNVIVT